MIKYTCSILFILFTLSASAQKKSVVKLISSKSSQLIQLNGKDVVKVYQGVFTQDYSTMRSDSGYFYARDNAFDAFGHVNITQGDTLNIYSDKLNYNGNTKTAILTDNVTMVDKDATLTTNYLTYNTGTRIGTYTGGGKLVNKDNTLTSKNGYYFANSRDAYFRYNVVLITPDALIKTDTLRYNSGTRIAFFYGPTNIYDTKDKKDTLYTENGLYNTITEQAFFGKKNLYKQGTKTLTGDSLFYDRLKGYGRAVKNVIFKDREQNITLRGQLATYYREAERTVVTQDPYVILVTEEKDTTATDSVPVAAADSVSSKGSKVKAAKPTTVKRANALAVKPPAGTMPVKVLSGNQPAADTAVKAAVPPAPKVKRDSIYISADTLETQMLTFKNLKLMQERQRLSGIRDTSAKGNNKTGAQAKKTAQSSKFLTLNAPKPWRDTTHIWQPELFGKPKPLPAKNAATADKGKAPTKEKPGNDDEDLDSDPIFYTPPVVLKDTARVRIVKAYHHAKLFKSDLQAKSDSMFYSYSDSTLRCYIQPLIWTQGSQLSGDTINLQMKNKKLDNMTLFPSSFIVNLEKGDSSHYNQISGKRMKGFFLKNKLDRMYVVGNSESIYFSRDSLKNVDGMQRSLSSRMRVYFKNGEARHIFFITKPEHRYGPLNKFTEEDKVLKGFIWKPKERPVSKESIIPSYNRRLAANNTGQAKKTAATKPPATANGQNKSSADTAQNKKTATSPANVKSDTSNVKAPAGNISKDSVAVKVPVKINTDSTNNTPAPIKNRQQQENKTPLMPKNIKRDTTVTKQF
ncbi:OstA-like protein [Mucilaginibacter litoreus]|uniref:OstA-like protein n=1 Tax=Mucilaginibacter litoreus TaxID=1048221 RepID=A0ABW3AQX2_9SPHI